MMALQKAIAFNFSKVKNNLLSPILLFGGLLSILNISNGLLGYAYQIIIGRLLSPMEYALFNSVMALSMFLGAPLGALILVIVRTISALRAMQEQIKLYSFYLHNLKILVILSLLFLCCLFISIGQIQEYFQIKSPYSILLLGLLLILGGLNTLNLAFLQGVQRFLWLGCLGITGSILKMIFSPSLIALGFSVNGALGGIVIAAVISYFIGYKLLHSSLEKTDTTYTFPINIIFLKQAIPVLVASIAFALMTQLDSVLVYHFFSPHLAGLYAAASVLGKATLYLPGGLVLAMFPIVSESHASGNASLKPLAQAMIASIAACACICICYWFWGAWIMNFFYGPNYKEGGLILKWYGIAILPFAIVMIAEQFLIARGKVIFAWIFLVISPFQILLINHWHNELWNILLIMGTFGTGIALIGFIFMWQTLKKK